MLKKISSFFVAGLLIASAATADDAAFSDQELFTALGQYMALNGGIVDLQLNEAQIESFASGLARPLVDLDAFEDVSDEELQQSIDKAIERLEAAEAEAAADSLPDMSATNALHLGFIVAIQSGVLGIELSGEEAGWVAQGAKEGARMTEPPARFEDALAALSAFLQPRFEAAMARQMEEQMGGASVQAQSAGATGGAAEQNAVAQAYLAQLREEIPEVETTDSGLHFLVLEEGTGPKPGMQDVVRVHYHGTLIDGTVFDSSVQRGDPINFPMNRVVPGFSEGLSQISQGGKVRLFVPSHLGYGDRGQGQIPGGALIIFDCELIAINP